MLGSVVVITACVIVLGVFLAKYARLVRQADVSNRLARDLWESVNTRFGVIDARVVDLMAKSEVFSSRLTSQITAVRAQSVERSVTSTVEREGSAGEMTNAPEVVNGTETETRVLQMLSEGPRSSAEIKNALGRSREHTSRLMKGLFDRGLVSRNAHKKPYVYEITEAGKSHVVS